MSHPSEVLIQEWRNILPFEVGAKTCNACPLTFSHTHRQHHCRHCGKTFCSTCSQEIQFSSDEKRRLCERCYLLLKDSPQGTPFGLYELQQVLKRLERVPTKPASVESIPGAKDVMPLHFVIFLTGSRGDVQPYIALGSKMRTMGHRITIAAHKCFRDPVTEEGLQFYPMPGDPEDLMELMVSDVDIELLKDKLPKHRE